MELISLVCCIYVVLGPPPKMAPHTYAPASDKIPDLPTQAKLPAYVVGLQHRHTLTYPQRFSLHASLTL
jgi:hypothetical protein